MDEGSSSSPGFRGLMARRFPALGHRDFRLLWFGQMVSIAGSQMQNVAINWQIYQRTSSAVVLGLIGLVRVVPVVIFSLFGGVVADTYNRRRIMFITQSVMMASALGPGYGSARRKYRPVYGRLRRSGHINSEAALPQRTTATGPDRSEPPRTAPDRRVRRSACSRPVSFARRGRR